MGHTLQVALYGQETGHIIRCSLFDPSEAKLDLIAHKQCLFLTYQAYASLIVITPRASYCIYPIILTGRLGCVTVVTTQEEYGQVYFGDIISNPSLSPSLYFLFGLLISCL